MIRFLSLLLVVSSCTAVETALPVDIIEKINHKVNDVPYVADQENYNKSHYLASLEEFYEKGGDCEEYVIAKISHLLEAGVPEEAMRIVLVRTPYFTQHVVLQIETNGRRYILDNNSNKLENDDYLYDKYRDPRFLRVSEIDKLR